MIADRRVLTAVVVAVWAVTGAALVGFAGRHHGFDLTIYRGALHSWWDGTGLYAYHHPGYGGMGFVYPPFAALVLSPLALLPAGAALGAVTVVNLVILAGCGWWLARPLGLPGWFTVALVLPLGVALEPVRDTLGFGQVNLLLAFLVLVDGWLLARGRRDVAGFGIGVAAAIKLTPAVFVVYLLLRREWRPAANALAAAAAATLLAAAVDWRTSWQFWTSMLWDTSRVGRSDSTPNQSLLGLVARLYDDSTPPRWPWLLAVLVVLAVGLARAVRAEDRVAALTVVGLTGCLVSPISWVHHLVWVGPAIVVLLRARRPVAAVATYGLAVSSIVFWWRRAAPHHWDLGLAGMVQENAYVLLLLALVLWLPTRSGARDPTVRGEVAGEI
ncbi:MAG TPA: glycosyltransferase family 87 protein [Mycobacteriales bacterium]